MGIRFVVMEMVAMRIQKALINTTKIFVIELEKAMILRPPRGEVIRLTCMQYAVSVCACNKDSIADFGSW